MTVDRIRWGIISTGNIAAQFARGLADVPDAELVAVGSRTQDAADAFGAQFNAPHRFGSYQAVADDPDVDVVYVGTPHSLHHANTLMCLTAGKPVLCEKPFAINAGQAREMMALAREKKLFLMDAIWSRCLPAFDKIRELLGSGALGDIRMVTADFGFKPAFDPVDRLFDPALGGGALLDIGVYPVMLASLVFGPPVSIDSHAQLGRTSVDEQIGLVFGYDQGKMAVLSATFQAQTTQEANIFGSEGRIRIHRQFWRPDSLGLSLGGGPEETLHVPATGNGYPHEAAEVMACLRAGRLESAKMPLDETLAIMETLDRIRAQWGLRYPME